MKTVCNLRALILTFLIGLAMIFILPPKSSGQDTISTDKQKVFKLKISTSGSDSGVSIDTTIIMEGDFDGELLEQYLEGVGESLKSFDFYLGDVNLRDGEFREMERGLRKMEKEMQQIQWTDQNGDGIPKVTRMTRSRGETLSDVFGDIPMSAVTSYKIKETKNGRRITIEVSDDYPEFDRDEIMIMRSPSGPRLVREQGPSVRHIRVTGSVTDDAAEDGEVEVEVEVEVVSPEDDPEEIPEK